MNAQTSRRALLQGAVMLTAAPAVALGGVPVFNVVGEEPEPMEAETSIVRLFHEWRAVQAEANEAADDAALLGLSVQERDAVWEVFQPRRHRIEDAVRDTPASDLRDMAIKVMLLSGDGTWGVPNALILECAHIAGRDFADLPRCVFQEDED